MFRTLIIMLLGLILTIAMLAIKYKPVYVVKVNDEILGYIENEESFKNKINEKIINNNGENIDSVSLYKEPQYELELIKRNKETNESEIIVKLEETAITTYKFYAVTLDGKTQEYVDTLEEAKKVVEKIDSEYKGNDLDLDISIDEKYTQNAEDVKTDNVEVAETSLEDEIEKILEKQEAKKALATINGINLSVLPVSGTITSRFGESSSIRSSTHTGLDIACKTGTDIKVIADGKVVFTEYNGSYGNLIKVDHGNGVQTWYAHCNKIYSNVGDTVKSGDRIGAVGSTGNSTGPHLHLEIRINSVAINPQKYLYKK